MSQAPVTAALREMYAAARRVCRDDRATEELARCIANELGWTLADHEALKRVRAMLRPAHSNGQARRHFPADFVPLAVKIAVRHGAEDLVGRLLFESVALGQQGRAELDALPARPGMATVRRERVRRTG